tara:strand:- start:644 stop:862 length:219 start_codon:yes stop_codon:yes gene_type:complete
MVLNPKITIEKQSNLERYIKNVPLFHLACIIWCFITILSVFSQPNHWLHFIPIGVTGIFAGIKVKKDNIDAY